METHFSFSLSGNLYIYPGLSHIFSSYLHSFLAREADRFLVCPSQSNLISSSKPTSVQFVGFFRGTAEIMAKASTLTSLLVHRLWGSHSDVPAVRCHPVATTNPSYCKEGSKTLCHCEVQVVAVASRAIRIMKVNVLACEGGHISSLMSGSLLCGKELGADSD